MRPSKYNVIVPYHFNREYSAVYNVLRDTAGVVTPREAEYIRTCDRDLCIHYTKVAEFADKGFIVEDNESELTKLKADFLTSKFDPRILDVSLVPADRSGTADVLGCSESLTGCLEHGAMMNRDVQSRILSYLTHSLADAEQLDVHWEGENPLMAEDVVLQLGEEIKKLAEKRNVKYHSGIVVSTVPSVETARKLSQIGIKEYRIMGTGLGLERNTTERHPDAVEWMRKIEDIKALADYADRFELLTSLDGRDNSEIAEIPGYLKTLGLDGKVFLKVVMPIGSGNETYGNNQDDVSNHSEAIRIAMEQSCGLSGIACSGCYCTKNSAKGLMIDSHGSLFKCNAEREDGLISGKLDENGIPHFNRNYYAHVTNSPLDQKACEECKLLPVCKGGCVAGNRNGTHCVFQTMTDDSWADPINAYLVKRLIDGRFTNPAMQAAAMETGIGKLLVSHGNPSVDEFLKKAQSTYLLGDLNHLAEKNGFTFQMGEGELLLQLIQPTSIQI